MRNLKQVLQELDYFVDNEYLDKYVRLVETNRRTKRTPRQTNSHHVIPKSWFKLVGLPVDSSLQNLVNLQYRNHVLAHYYLCLCTRDELQYANELALMCLF